MSRFDELKVIRADRDHWFEMWETARAELAAVREAVIEECARVAEDRLPSIELQDGMVRLGFLQAGMEIAAAIRTLKETKP